MTLSLELEIPLLLVEVRQIKLWFHHKQEKESKEEKELVISLFFFDTLRETNCTYDTSETIDTTPQSQPKRIVSMNL